MLEETVEIICPNPKCQRKIKEPILLTVLSVSPRKEYEACPYCFVRLDKEITPEDEETAFETEYEEIEDEIQESSTETATQKDKSSGQSFLDKVKALIPTNGNQKKEAPEVEETEEAEELDEEEQEMAPEEQETEEADEEYEEAEDPEDEETEEDEEEEDQDEEDEEEGEESAEDETDEEETEAEPEKETKTSDGECPESFGYLANRPKDAPIPSGCLTCPRMVDCMLKVGDD